jgi:hypothetical protein
LSVVDVVVQPIGPPTAPQPPPYVAVQVTLDVPPCTVLDDTFGGTYRGGAMIVVSPGDATRCTQPSLQIRLDTVTPTDETIEVHYGTTSIIATFDADALAPRQTTPAATWSLTCGQPFQFGWSSAADVVAGGGAQIVWHETVPCLFEGCLGPYGSFSVGGTMDASGQTSFTVPSVTLGSTGAGNAAVTVAAAHAGGAATTCDGASACDYDFSHPAIQAANLVRTSCP